MKLTEERLKQVFQQQTARSTARQRECISEDQFVRVATGELSQPERQQIAHHLISCADCVEEYRSLRPLDHWVEDVEPRSDLVAQRKLSGPSFADRITSLFGPSWATAALAVALLLMTSGIVWLVYTRQKQESQIARLNQQLSEHERTLAYTTESLEQTRRQLTTLEESTQQGKKEDGGEGEQPSEANSKQETAKRQRELGVFSQPQLEVPIVDLDPMPVRGGSDQVTTIEVPRTANAVTFILNFSGEPQSNYEVELVTGTNKRVWQGRVRKESGSRSLNVTLPRSLISNGNYLLRLYGLRDGRREPVAEYAVLLQSR